MSLKFGKTIKTLRLSQNYSFFVKIKTVIDKHTQTTNFI